MNRRNFIKSAVIASIAVPTVVSAIKLPPAQLERVNPSGNFIDILTIDELKNHGIRAAIYSANCVDSNGVFAHEKGYCDEHHEPFIRFIHPLCRECAPHILAYNEASVESIKWTRCYNIDKIISKIKESMEYVCLVAYVHCPAVPEEAWPEKWMPVVGGLSKHRYNRIVRTMNDFGPFDCCPEHEKLCVTCRTYNGGSGHCNCANCRCKSLG